MHNKSSQEILQQIEELQEYLESERCLQCKEIERKLNELKQQLNLLVTAKNLDP